MTEGDQVHFVLKNHENKCAHQLKNALTKAIALFEVRDEAKELLDAFGGTPSHGKTTKK